MMTLESVDVRRQVRVILIEGGHGVRSHLNTLGIHIGDWLTVVERAPFRGPVLVDVNGTRVAIGRGIANKVKVDVGGAVETLSDIARTKRAASRCSSSFQGNPIHVRVRSSMRLRATVPQRQTSRARRFPTPSAGR